MMRTQYTVIDLSPHLDWCSGADDINSSSQIVGDVEIPPSRAELYHAYLWEYDGPATDLGRLAPRSSGAQAINQLGQVVGWFDKIYEKPRACLWAEGTLQDLGTLPGHEGSQAFGINRAGEVVGYSFQNFGRDGRAFLHRGGVMHDLGTLGGRHSWAQGVNDSGQVVGWSEVTREASASIGWGVTHTFVWQDGAMRDLGTLGGPESRAYCINARGQVVGWSDLASGERHACLWSGGQILDLEGLGGKTSLAFGINSAGHIVGLSDWRAFLYVEGEMIDLNTRIPADSGWQLSQATAINDLGQIVGWGKLDEQSHGFLLTPR